MKTIRFNSLLYVVLITLSLSPFLANGQSWTTSTAGPGNLFPAIGQINMIGTAPLSSPDDIIFITDGNEYMRLMGSIISAPHQGYLALGNGYTVSAAYPNYLLDLYQGDVNTSSTYGYRINGYYMLWNNGILNSVYTGLGAGNPTATGTNNTMTGYDAGNSLGNGKNNTFTGASAGISTTGGAFPAGCYNTMTGYDCGLNNMTGYANNYYGKDAGNHNNGDDNCMYGGHSGNDNASTDSNVYMGNYCNAQGGTGAPGTGSNNVYMGVYAALHNNGSYNAMIGANAGQDNINTDSNIFMGSYAAFSNLAGYNNVFIGTNSADYSASTAGVSSNMNVFVGGNTGIQHVYGDYNVLLGYRADAYTVGISPPSIGPIFNAPRTR